MLAGGRGESVRQAIAYQIEVGRFWGEAVRAGHQRAHDGRHRGDGRHRLDSAGCASRVALGPGTVTATTTNARCIDFDHCQRLGQDDGEAAKEREVIGCLRRMDILTTDTCINYQTVYQPHLGEHVAWGDTGTVIYTNSVFGARSNFESGPAALAAALTGRTPEYGFHLDQPQAGQYRGASRGDRSMISPTGVRWASWSGEFRQNYFAVPVFHGFARTPMADELKHLGAALASYGSMGMFHFVGVTPEAPSLAAALGGTTPSAELVVDEAALDRVYRGYSLGNGDARLVVFSGPQQSLFEMKELARLFGGRKLAAGTTCFVTTNAGVLAQSRRLGYADVLERAGITILEGVCFYILQNLSALRVANGWTNMVSNSAKIVNIIGAHRFNTILRRTADCVDIACTGRLA